MLYTTRERLAIDLCYLAKEDYSLLNDIILEYCDLISTQRLDELEDYCSQEIRSIVWSLLTTTVMLLNVIITECNKHLHCIPKSFIILNVNEGKQILQPFFTTTHELLHIIS